MTVFCCPVAYPIARDSFVLTGPSIAAGAATERSGSFRMTDAILGLQQPESGRQLAPPRTPADKSSSLGDVGRAQRHVDRGVTPASPCEAEGAGGAIGLPPPPLRSVSGISRTTAGLLDHSGAPVLATVGGLRLRPEGRRGGGAGQVLGAVSYTHLRAHE